ncbi:hypothetical protein FRC02_000440 [Tulasnella sp. 418]|nr:hypothetical protein FRC02_000440 [Tulasnella sp. 418]
MNRMTLLCGLLDIRGRILGRKPVSRQRVEGPVYDAIAQWDLTDRAKVKKKEGVFSFSGFFSDVHYGLMRLDGGVRSEIAMKLLRFHGRITSQLNIKHLERVFREVYIWTRLQHPNIAEFHGFIMSKNPNELPTIISQWYKNGNLVKYVVERSLRNRVSLLRDVASAVVYLHSKSIVHGDIKGVSSLSFGSIQAIDHPTLKENVLIDDSGRARLCDFGLSHFVDDFSGDLASLVQLSSANCGYTLRFTSPELLESDRSTPMSDIWALGCLAMQILTGQIPYARLQHKYHIKHSIKQYEPPFEILAFSTRNPLEDALLKVISKCWDRELRNRPSASEFFDKVEELISQGLVCMERLSLCH